MNCASKRRNARKHRPASSTSPNLGYDFLETAPGRSWSSIACAFRAWNCWDGACRLEQYGSAAVSTDDAPGATHDAKTCDVSIVKNGRAYSVQWATYNLEAGICGNQLIQVG